MLTDKKYISAKEDGLHLTAKAKKNLAQCVINIREQTYTTYRNIQKDFIGFAEKLHTTERNVYYYLSRAKAIGKKYNKEI